MPGGRALDRDSKQLQFEPSTITTQVEYFQPGLKSYVVFMARRNTESGRRCMCWRKLWVPVGKHDLLACLMQRAELHTRKEEV